MVPALKNVILNSTWNLRIKTSADDQIRVRLLAPNASWVKPKSAGYELLDTDLEDYTINVQPKDTLFDEDLDLLCDVEVPANQNIEFKSKRSIDIENLRAKTLQVYCSGDITTKNIATSNKLYLESKDGNITCGSLDSRKVLVLAHHCNVSAFEDSLVSRPFVRFRIQIRLWN